MKSLRNALLCGAVFLWVAGWVYSLIPAAGLLFQHESAWWAYLAFFGWLLVVLGMATGFVPRYILLPLWKQYWWIVALGTLAALAFGVDPFFEFLASLEGRAKIILVIFVGIADLAIACGIVLLFVRALLFSKTPKDHSNK